MDSIRKYIGFFINCQKKMGLIQALRYMGHLSFSSISVLFRKKRYNILNADQLKRLRKTDTVFIFGSGYSLNDIEPDWWKHFEKFDTLGFSGFVYQDWVRVDFHLIRGWVEIADGAMKLRKYTEDYVNRLNRNPFFNNTTLIMQGDFSAHFCNNMLARGYIRPGTNVYRYRTVKYKGLLTEDLTHGLRHARGTLSDAINLAYCMGWKKIVLVGVDLYDSRYFWVQPEKTLNYDEPSGTFIASDKTHHGRKAEQSHNTVAGGIVELVSQWRVQMAENGVDLFVFNPRSLLSQVVEIYPPLKAKQKK